MICNHGIIHDHSRLDGERRLWKCTGCRRESHWTDTHNYDGTIECKHCGFAEIHAVACSDVCRALLGQPSGVTQREAKAAEKTRRARDRELRRADRHGETLRRAARDLSADDLRTLLASKAAP